MINKAKNILKKTFVHRWYMYACGKYFETLGMVRHQKKERTLRRYQDRFNISTLVETGTYMGEMVSAMKDRFKKIYSIELGEAFAKAAQEKFAAYPHVTILQGDSGVVLQKLIADIKNPALFWLDGHYSGGNTARGDSDTPINAELAAILDHFVHGHVILIDDARCFDGKNGYPTIGELTALVSRKNPKLRISVAADIVRIHE